MNTIDKYLTEAKMGTELPALRKFIQKPKSGKYQLGDDIVSVTHAGDTLILKYPSELMDFTYNLIQVCDTMKLDYQEIGMSDRKNMKFIIDLG